MPSGHQAWDDDLVLQPSPPEGPGLSYQTAAAFDAAIKDRIAIAAAASDHSIAELRRQFAYDRLLARIFINEPQRWVLKGGAGLLARRPDTARHSQDIDLFFQGEADAATSALQAAAVTDLSDYFAFTVEHASALIGLHPGDRYKATAYLGAQPFANFGLDLVVETNMTGSPDIVTNLSPIVVEGLPTAAYLTYPVVDHIADKHAAMLSTYNERTSTRYRDLVDLVLLATTYGIDGPELTHALMSEYAHRGLSAPTEVTLPSSEWVAGYASARSSAPSLKDSTAAEALVIVKQLLDPVLAGTAVGIWDPSARVWSQDHK